MVPIEALALADVVDESARGGGRAPRALDVAAILDAERLGAAARAAQQGERAERGRRRERQTGFYPGYEEVRMARAVARSFRANSTGAGRA